MYMAFSEYNLDLYVCLSLDRSFISLIKVMLRSLTFWGAIANDVYLSISVCDCDVSLPVYMSYTFVYICVSMCPYICVYVYICVFFCMCKFQCHCGNLGVSVYKPVLVHFS